MKRGFGVAAVVLLAAACGGGDDDDGGDEGGGLGGGDGFADQLAGLPLPPDADGILTVSFGDLARAAELAGVDLPAARDAGTDEQVDTLNAVTGVRYDPEDPGAPVAAVPPDVANVQRLVDVEEFTAEVGWNVFDVQRFVELPMPPDQVTVLQGDFDEGALTEAMGEPEDGVWVLGTPGERDLEDITAARPLGEALFLSLDGDRLIVAKTEEAIAVARSGDGRTVGDDEVLTGLAEVLEGADAYSGLLFHGDLGGLGVAGALSPEQMAAACEESLSVPFAGMGVGVADGGDDGPVFLFAYATAGEDAAATLAEEVEELVAEGDSAVDRSPWSDRLTVDEVTADGDFVLARLRPARPGPAALWHQLAYHRDNLTTHC